MNATATTHSTLSQHILPEFLNDYPLLRQAFLVLMGSLLIGALAQLSLRFPGSPVPVTGQTLAVLLAGMVLGARLGAVTVLAYCLEGIWFPVFAEMRTWGHPATIYTAGYIFGFVGAAYVTGFLAERGWDRRPIGTALAMLLGNLVLYIPGLLWLGFMLAPAPMWDVLQKGMLLFLMGDLMKLFLAMAFFPAVWTFVNKRI